MEAVVSGRAGVALLLNGERVYSIHVDDPGQFVPRRSADLPYLLNDADDLRFLRDVGVEAVQEALESASVEADMLALFLIVVDGSRSEGIRGKAAAALETLLTAADPEVRSATAMRSAGEQLLNLLHARPLPDSADVRGARAACGAVGARELAALLKALEAGREAIRDVETAWEAVPARGFAGQLEKPRWRAALIRSGAFRALALGESTEEIVRRLESVDATADPGIGTGAGQEAVIRLWQEKLHEVRTARTASRPAHTALLEQAAECERGGDGNGALRRYEDAYRQAVSARDALGLMEVVIRQGRCLRRAGEEDVAQDILRLALTLAELHGYGAHAARALYELGALMLQAGESEGAERTYLLAREHAAGAEDRQLMGEIELGLGALESVRGDSSAALAHYLQAWSHLLESGEEGDRASALLALGRVHIALGHLDEAERYARQAHGLSERVANPRILGDAHLLRAELFVARDQTDLARASCDRAHECASRLGDDVRRAEVLRVYGTIYRMDGKLHLAESYLNQALAVARSRVPLLEAEALRELGVVLRAQGRNREALEALNRSHALFTALGAQAHRADVNARISQLETDFLSLVRFWGESIEAKDRYTSGHCERVADYACRIAAEVGLTERELVWLRMGAFLHDVGKTEIPEEILNKPGRLTDQERAIMERHTIVGDEILAPVDFPWDIRPMVRSHHERWDGRGYPDGLTGEAIPLAARILSIAETFDALTTTRSYRRPLPPDEALAIMEADEGAFDPELFETFREIFSELGFSTEGGESGEGTRGFPDRAEHF